MTDLDELLAQLKAERDDKRSSAEALYHAADILTARIEGIEEGLAARAAYDAEKKANTIQFDQQGMPFTEASKERRPLLRQYSKPDAKP
jgi:hypothetical protein